jgi:hypothetical protein
MKKACGEVDCAMCKAGIVGRNATKAITLGTPGALEAAVLQFNMSPTAVMEHCNTHEIKVDEAEGVYESNDFYMDRILKQMKRMDQWFKVLESGTTDQTTIRLGLSIVREMRMTTESLAEFQGRLERKGNTTVQIETLNMQYNQLTTAIMEGVCPECRARIIQHLSAQRNVIPATFKDVSDKTLLKEC